jgi:hypothetical protein
MLVPRYPGALYAVLPVLLFSLSCIGAGDERGADGLGDPEQWEGDVAAATRVLRPQEGTERDWEIFGAAVTDAWDRGLDTLPIGQTMIQIGLDFLGFPYAPGTLEVAGDEAVVVNFEEFDCVTLVENVLALARFVKIHESGILESEPRAEEAYRDLLREIRYRNARVEGYPSRLHYFSDWIANNEEKDLVREMTREMGGVLDAKAIDFMTTHPEAYRQLSDPANLFAMESMERALSRSVRYKIPQDQISVWAPQIQDGDIIAATSTVDGLDVAHTGLAIWRGSELHLLHAPLVGDSVQVSPRPLAERILRLEGQDGIRVARPLEVDGGQPSSAR